MNWLKTSEHSPNVEVVPALLPQLKRSEIEDKIAVDADLSDLSHSFPFLHLARKHRVKYEYVLKLVEHYDRGTLKPPHDALQPFHDIWRVCHAPWRFDMSKAQERGI